MTQWIFLAVVLILGSGLYAGVANASPRDVYPNGNQLCNPFPISIPDGPVTREKAVDIVRQCLNIIGATSPVPDLDCNAIGSTYFYKGGLRRPKQVAYLNWLYFCN